MTHILSGIMEERLLLVSLCYTLITGGIMALTYRLSHDTLSYNRKFNIALVMMACVSTVLLTLVQENPLFSLGVLGSLSICRIRMNTKDPRDLGFVFWALSIGIASAEQAYFAGAVCAIVISALLILSSRVIRKPGSELLVVKGGNDELQGVRNLFKRVRGVSLQSENIFENTFESVYELNMKTRDEEKLLQNLKALNGVESVSLLAPETQIV